MSTGDSWIGREMAGRAITLRPDYVVITDGPSHRCLEHVSTVAHPERVKVIFDHDVPAGSPEGAARLGKINRFARQFGCAFIQGVGVGYQWMLDQVVRPGEIVIGGGAHNSIYGAAGALGLNVSAEALGRVLEEGVYPVTVPETFTVALTGRLAQGCSAVDAALTLLAQAGASLKGKTVVFVCRSGGLSRQDKAILCGMACGTGAVTALFAGRGEADLTLDLAGVTSMVRLPCAGREVQTSAPIESVEALHGITFQAGQIGGFTGGTIAGLRRAAGLMEGKTLARGFRLSIVPATAGDYLLALKEGLIERFLSFNAQIHAVGDRSAVQQGPGVIDTGERLITTGLYTYDGCMGAPGSQVYTASIESVLRAATSKTL